MARPKKLRPRFGAKVRYPFIVWPFGPAASSGFIVRFPDLPGCPGAVSLEAEDAISKAHEGLVKWLKEQRTLKRRIPRPGSGDYCGGIPPSAPIFDSLTDLQREAAEIDGMAWAKAAEHKGPVSRRGRKSQFLASWATISAEEVVERLRASRSPDFDLNAATINRWRSLPAYWAHAIGAWMKRLESEGKSEIESQLTVFSRTKL